MSRKRWFAASIAMGMLVTGAAGVYAGSKLQEIKAFLNPDIGITVNGKDFKPVDDKGKAIVPITYDNTTYLPVRAVSEALQVPVKYDSASNKVRIGSGTSTTPEPGETKPPAASTERPKYIPADFPFPKDAQKVYLQESADGKKSVMYIYKTKAELATLDEMYSSYLKSKKYNNLLNSSNKNSLSIMGDSATESAMISSESNGSRDADGYIEISVNWSEL